MAHEVRAVVARGKGEPVSVEMILVPDPGPGEALVAVMAAGRQSRMPATTTTSMQTHT